MSPTDPAPEESFGLPPSEVRPSQLYLSAAKLEAVVADFDFADPAYGPLPAFEYGGEWYLSDGHTRAFVAYLAGVGELELVVDREVREEYDFEVYRRCVEWCREAGVTGVPDLAGRVMDHEAFEREWIDRCHRVAGE